MRDGSCARRAKSSAKSFSSSDMARSPSAGWDRHTAPASRQGAGKRGRHEPSFEFQGLRLYVRVHEPNLRADESSKEQARNLGSLRKVPHKEGRQGRGEFLGESHNCRG